MFKRNSLLSKGLFPETLPPCFDSRDFIRGMNGIVSDLQQRIIRNGRATAYIRYVGTKHDGSRRHYATPNPIAYFGVCSFIQQHSKTFENKFGRSDFSISKPRPGTDSEDRAIVLSSLSELSDRISENIRYSPYLLKTDIAQFFPSIYTHSIPWVAHGRDRAKADRERHSKSNRFNLLDWCSQQCQNGQTRGILVGPDAFRIIAEFIASEIDAQLKERAADLIVGAVRHVDDFYIGVRSEIDATVVLSHLREVLQNFELLVNDNKTKIISGLYPVDDVWAQEIRRIKILEYFDDNSYNYMLDRAFEICSDLNSESPIKLALRKLDQHNCYQWDDWEAIEAKLQRILQHFPHCIDYACLLLAKRFAIGGGLDREGWGEAIALLLRKHLTFNHHHELAWLLWAAFVCDLPIEKRLIEEVSKTRNSHTQALLVAGFTAGKCPYRPKITFSNSLSSTSEHWLHNLEAKSRGFTRAPFQGSLKDEFEHMAGKHTRLLNFENHMK